MAKGVVFSLAEVRQILLASCVKEGGMRAWARKYGVTAGHISRVLAGEKEPGEKVLAPLGFRTETIYRLERYRHG